MMNLLVAVSHNYIKPLKVMLLSLASCTDEPLEVYLMHSGLSQRDTGDLTAFASASCHGQLHGIEVDPDCLNGAPVCGFSVEVYYRVIAHILLPERLDRILWLDADIVVRKDLSALYHREFDGNLLLACRDVLDGSECIQTVKRRIGFPQEAPYFNSGVLLMNLEAIRREVPLSAVLRCIDEQKGWLTFPDQDVLNLLYRERVGFLPDIYNLQTDGGRALSADELAGLSARAAVVHFVGWRKPWLYGCKNPARRFFDPYAAAVYGRKHYRRLNRRWFTGQVSRLKSGVKACLKRLGILRD